MACRIIRKEGRKKERKEGWKDIEEHKEKEGKISKRRL